MLKKIINSFYRNRLYYCGLVGILIIFGIILSFYCNTATQLNDGWLDIYSHYLLNGGVLYSDYNFPLLPFPVYLFTLVTKIFGEKMLVSHIAGAVLKLCILSIFYTLLQKFFGYRNALWGTIVSGCILISLIYDCCLFSYNDLMYFFGLIVSLCLIKETECLQEGKNGIFYALLTGFILGVMLISKQTHGVIISTAALVLQFLSILKYKNLKQAFLYSVATIVPILLVTTTLFIYIFKTHTLIDFYNNVIGGMSSKGDVNGLIFHHFKVLADSSLTWVIYAATCAFLFVICATKNINKTFKIHDNKYDNMLTIGISTISAVIIVFAAYKCVAICDRVFDFHLFLQIDKFFKQVCAVGFVVTDILCFYMFFDYIFEKETSRDKFLFFIFISMIFALNYSIMISKPMVNLAFYSIGILISWLLQQETPLYRLKNGIVYIFAGGVLFLGAMSKLICPIYWHCWQAGNITHKLKYVENIPFMQGMKLPVDEAEFFEEIRKISDKYTTLNDEIYCFLNNQIFYSVLERKPFTENVNLYFDLCSDEKADSDMQKLLKNPPKMIIWLNFPDFMIGYHEYLFRGGRVSGQRHINEAIANMVYHKKYKVVKSYKNKYTNFANNYKKFVDEKADKEFLRQIDRKIKLEEKQFKKIKSPDYSQIWQHNKKLDELQIEKSKIWLKYRDKLDVKHYRYFLPAGYELFVLIRNDLL